MTVHLLDTSALLLHFLREPGWEQVHAALAEGHARLAAPSRLEFLVRLSAQGAPDEEAEGHFAAYQEITGALVAVDEAAVERAWTLRRLASMRLPVVDALIAGCAAREGAVLMHRNPHMASIPTTALAQARLPDR